MTEPPQTDPLRVVIVGGGIAALETVLALHDLAGARARVTLIAPEADFVLRPLAVATPFSRGHVDRLALADVMAEHGGRFVRDAVLGIDAEARTVALAGGGEIAYDALVLAPGARSVPAFAHALTFGTHQPALNAVLADLEEGWSRSVAFVVPEGCTWPLPLYELALMTAEAMWSMNTEDTEVHLVTPEAAPLELFGDEASGAVGELLDAAHITMHYGFSAEVPQSGRVVSAGRPEVVADCVVAMALLRRVELYGVPARANGFIPVDDVGLVEGMDGVYAVGDAADRPIKQGGLACQQADVAAAHIAARAGADVEVPPLTQVLSGRLLTGGSDHLLRDAPSAGVATTARPLWWPTKVSGRYLSPYLVAKDLVHLPARGERPGPSVDITARVPLSWERKRVDPDILGLPSLGPMSFG